MIILEGPDRCGKTTVARILQRLLPGWSYRHHTKPPIKPYSYFGLFLADSVPNVIVDRLHWSELAYGNTYRGGSELSYHEWRYLELMLLARQARIIYLTDEIENIKERWNKDEMFDVSGLEKLHGEYEALYYRTSAWRSYIPAYWHTLKDLVYDNKPTKILLNLINQEIDCTRRANQFINSAAFCGLLDSPHFLLLGEQPGNAQMKKGDLGPHVALSHGKACEYLWLALDRIGLKWATGHYTNVSEFIDTCDLETFLLKLTPDRIVCLGEKAFTEAKKACQKIPNNSMTIARVNHPSYVKRFLHNEFNQYCVELRLAFGEDLCQKK